MKSGKAVKKTSHKNRRLDDHLTNKFEVVEENAKDAPVKDVAWKGQTLDTQGDIALEEDTGHGTAVVVRCFTFAINPDAFRKNKPTKQELFNAHYKQIEIELWKDGLKVFPEWNPKVNLTKNKKFYSIFVASTPARGHLLNEKPKTLTGILHGTS